MGKMTVYHGSYTTKVVPEIIKGKNTKDFGPGFYCTVIREQAERWAKRYDTPVVNIYTVRMNTSLKILEFKEMTEKWLDFIKTEGLKGVQLLAGGWSKITKDYKITGIPRFMVFDKKGNIVSVDVPRPSSPELKKMLENELKK